MIKALCVKAERISKCSRAWIVRCDPHPGHLKPVSVRKEHFGKKICSAGLNLK